MRPLSNTYSHSRALTLGLALILSANCLGNEDATFPVSEVKWDGFMGKREKAPKSVLTLMSKGFLGMPFMGDPTFCDDIDKQIADWIQTHPKANAVPVSLLPLSDDFAFMYVWVVDGPENLNLMLVRNGCCTAEQQGITEMGELLIAKDESRKFSEQVALAQVQAIQQKSGIWAKRGFDREAHWQTAEQLERDEKYEEAIAEFRATLDGGNSDRFGWLRIARCYDKLELYPETIAAYDKSIEADDVEGSRLARIEKAECISRHEGPEKADAEFQSLTAKCADDLEPCVDFASAQAGQQRFETAVQTLESAVNLFMAKQKLAFDGDRFVLDASRIGGRDKYFENLQHLASALSTAARYCQYAKEWDQAFRYASQGLALDQAVKKHLGDQFDSLTAEAGDFECRLVRANVFMHRQSFVEAKKEIDYAKVLVDVGNIQGGFIKQTISDAYAELQRQFPEEKVKVPPVHKPKPRHPDPPKPEELAVATSDSLISMAKGEDSGASYAALEELVTRNAREPFSEDVLDRLIEDCLTLQGDTKRRWRAQYGVFVEKAQQSGALSPDQWIRYLRQSIVVSAFNAEFSDFELDKENKARLFIDHMFQARLGASMADRNKPRAGTKMCATVSIVKSELDGRDAVVIGPHEREPITRTWEMSPESEYGFGARVKDSSGLTSGSHTLAVTYRFEVRTGDRCLALPGTEPAKPLVYWEYTARTGFVVPDVTAP